MGVETENTLAAVADSLLAAVDNQAVVVGNAVAAGSQSENPVVAVVLRVVVAEELTEDNSPEHLADKFAVDFLGEGLAVVETQVAVKTVLGIQLVGSLVAGTQLVEESGTERPVVADTVVIVAVVAGTVAAGQVLGWNSEVADLYGSVVLLILLGVEVVVVAVVSAAAVPAESLYWQ